MISRRNIRVKVMQLLFMMDAAPGENAIKTPVAELQKSFDKSKELLVYIIYFITEVAKYAERDALKKANKHLPTADDLNVNIKLSGNEVIWQIIESASFAKVVEQLKPEHLLNEDVLKRVYTNLVKQDVYQLYITEQSRDSKKEKEILRFIFSDMMLPDEVFISHIEELFTNWDDDCEMIHSLVNSFISKTSAFNFQVLISEEKWQYAKSLLITTYNKRQYLLDIISEKLQNWDADRIAALDMVLMQMGLAEFLYFETIPTSVTINEYIDLAKVYSTDQSGNFINGILDNICKEYTAENKLNKIPFKQRNIS